MSVSQKYLRDENGNIFSPIINVDSIYNGGGGTLFDSIYPIGSVYISVNNTNPSTLFGGTWERIAQGRTLMGEGVVQANSDNWCGTTKAGDWTAYAGGMGGEVFHTLTVNQMPSHRHEGLRWGNIEPITLNSGSTNGYNLNYGGGNGGLINSITTTLTGGSQAHNNMPPYLVVFIWKRIS